jgi:hypothetical protein
MLLVGCATPSPPDSMSIRAGAAQTAGSGSRNDHSFRIGQVTGGENSGAIGLSRVTDDGLRGALGSSLERLGYLADDPKAAAYVVNADLVDLDRPAAAFDPALLVVPIGMSVTVKIRYVVTRASGGTPVFDETVATTGTGGAVQALTPYGRIRKGNEAAVRLNIAAFLQRLRTDWK